LSFLRVVGRLAPGVTASQAQGELEAGLGRFGARYPQAGAPDQKGRIVTLRKEVVGNSDRLLVLLMAAVALVMLIAVANLANLLLVNGSGRLQEFAARRALGATNGRIVVQLLTEALLLSAAGTLVGIIDAHLAVSALVVTSGNAIPRAGEVSVDPTAMLFAVSLGLTISFFAAVLPAIQLSRITGHGAGAERGVTQGGGPAAPGVRLRGGRALGSAGRRRGPAHS
jgi:hypothetical protein